MHGKGKRPAPAGPRQAKNPASEVASPIGWGLAPERREPDTCKVKGPGDSGLAYEFGAGTLAATDPIDVSVAVALTDHSVRQQLFLYQESGDETHLWRAWRSARTLGTIPADMFDRIALHIDRYTEAAIADTTRSEQRTRRYYILRDYYYLVSAMARGQGPTPPHTEIRQRVAERFKTTEGAVKQMVLEHEGRVQRRKR